jgi:ABC-2 type transport system permease protein
MLPKLRENIKIVNHSKPTSMIIIADGDIARNAVRKLAYDTIPMNLGYDRYTKETYGNKDFMLNAVNYLCDDAGLLNIRSRELKIRLLSKTRIAEERTMWQVINILGPIVMLIVFGIVLSYVRKRKNRKN